MTREWAKLDPAAELGDCVTINGVFSGIYVNETNFSTLMAARIAAPQENAVDHEYPYKSPTDRKTTRQFAETRASLRVNAASIQAEVTARETSEAEMRAALELHAQEIAARVTQTGGNSASFGWSLTGGRVCAGKLRAGSVQGDERRCGHHRQDNGNVRIYWK